MRTIERTQPQEPARIARRKTENVAPCSRTADNAGALAACVLLALLLWVLVALVSALVRDFWVILIASMQP